MIAIAGATGAILVWRDQIELATTLGRFASPIHERLAAGIIGYWTVVVATAIAIVLEIGGVVLWWKRKTVWFKRGAGWWRLCFDLHHVVGLFLFPLMLVIAVTGVLMPFYGGREYPEFYRLLAKYHIGHFPPAVKVLYTIATLAFAFQGITGVLMWWKPQTAAALRERVNKVPIQAD